MHKVNRLILTTASNGRTPGISIPSASGQRAVIERAYNKAHLDFSRTGYVEVYLSVERHETSLIEPKVPWNGDGSGRSY